MMKYWMTFGIKRDFVNRILTGNKSKSIYRIRFIVLWPTYPCHGHISSAQYYQYTNKALSYCLSVAAAVVVVRRIIELVACSSMCLVFAHKIVGRWQHDVFWADDKAHVTALLHSQPVFVSTRWMCVTCALSCRVVAVCKQHWVNSTECWVKCSSADEAGWFFWWLAIFWPTLHWPFHFQLFSS